MVGAPVARLYQPVAAGRLSMVAVITGAVLSILTIRVWPVALSSALPAMSTLR